MEDVIEKEKLETKKYTIDIFESNSKLVEIDAKTSAEARIIVMNKYLNGEIILDKDCDNADVQFNVV